MKILVQGITGKEASKAVKNMSEYGTSILCGVTPGKEGMSIHDIPVYNTVSNAIKKHPTISTSLVFVPPLHVQDAVIESINAGIQTILIITENVPVKDICIICNIAKKNNCKIIGPSSIGLIEPNKLKLGLIGGNKPTEIFPQGNIAIISKSGGMTSEISNVLKRANEGVSYAIGIGGDVIIGSDYIDQLTFLENHPETRVVVLYCELGGSYEEKLAEYLNKRKYPKPIIAYVAGDFAKNIKRQVYFGHTGALNRENVATAKNKKRLLKNVGVHIVDTLSQIPDTIKKINSGTNNEPY